MTNHSSVPEVGAEPAGRHDQNMTGEMAPTHETFGDPAEASGASPAATSRGPDHVVSPLIETPAPDRRLRVVMLLNGRSAFEPAWADAAATRVDLVRISIASEAGGAPTALPYLKRVPEPADSFQLASGPSPANARTVRGFAARVVRQRRVKRRLVRSLRLLQAHHGPFDLLHGHFSASAPTIIRGARALGVPYVITEHSSSYSGRNPNNRLSRRGLTRTRRACAGAGAVIPVSKELELAMRAHGVVAAFQVIPNPVDTRLFSAPDVLPGEATIELACVARLDQVKGHDLLLEAIASLRDTLPQLRLTLIGGGPLRDQLEAQARRLGLDGVVSFDGGLPPDAVAQKLRASHAFVLASRWENLSVAALEACATGLPCVLSRVGGLSEIDAEGITLVEPDDLTGLTRAIHATVTHLPDLGTRRRRAELARARYSVEAVGSRLDQIYRRVLGC